MKPRPWCRGSGWTVVWISCAATILAVAGCTTTLRDEEAQPTTTSTLPNPPGIATFDGIAAGDCLTWPDDQPDSIKTVSCNDAHRFEVASVVDLSTLPGSEFGPDAPPPSQARIQQISIEQCQPAAQQYLGTHYDPTSRFTISLLWAGKVAWELGDERRVFCGLQLQGVDDARSRFTGRVADLDQSKVWPPGTCLGIDPAGIPTDLPVSCAGPHSMEVTGSVNVGEQFPGGLPSEAEQDAFTKDRCTASTDAYLAPVQLRSTTLTVVYSTIGEPSWTAGSRQVACRIGAVTGDGAWSTLLNSAKGDLLIDGQPPAPR